MSNFWINPIFNCAQVLFLPTFLVLSLRSHSAIVIFGIDYNRTPWHLPPQNPWDSTVEQILLMMSTPILCFKCYISFHVLFCFCWFVCLFSDFDISSLLKSVWLARALKNEVRCHANILVYLSVVHYHFYMVSQYFNETDFFSTFLHAQVLWSYIMKS